MKRSSDITLNDVCALIVDCEHKTAPTQTTGYPSIRTPNIGRGRLILDNVNRVSEETYRAWTRRTIPQAGDLILAREAPAGNVAIITDNLKVCLGQRTVLIRPDRNQVEPHYLLYLLLDDMTRARLLSYGSGATVPHVNMSDIRDLPLPELPSLFTQRKIAAILSAYDDLIENNTRRIKILEEMAQMIYREWFVHFHFPGHGKVKMVDSPLGKIPEGWEVSKIEDLYNTASGGTPSRKVDAYFNGSINWIKTQELPDGFIFETDEKITESGLQNSSAKVFPVNSVIIAMYGATIGKLGILAQPASTNQACCALLQKEEIFEHAYGFLTLLERRKVLIGLRMGAAQQNISQVVIKNFKILNPSKQVLKDFNKVVNPMFNLIRDLQRKNQILRRTRDLLLPKLISGEVDVEEIDIIQED